MKRQPVRSFMSAAVAVAAVAFVVSCAFCARSFLRVDWVDVGDMQHSVVLESKSGSLFVREAHTSPWKFHPLNWNVYFHSWPRGRDLPTYHVSGESLDIIQTRLGFGWKRVGVNRLLKIPYWFLILTFGGLILLWGRQWRNQFSIRALLVATTLLAVAVGLAVASSRGSWSTLDV
jgi:hypothetical protein